MVAPSRNPEAASPKGTARQAEFDVTTRVSRAESKWGLVSAWLPAETAPAARRCPQNVSARGKMYVNDSVGLISEPPSGVQ
jgi:hypothetical protein